MLRGFGGLLAGGVVYGLAGSVLATVGAVVVGVVAPLLVVRLASLLSAGLSAAWWLIGVAFGILAVALGVAGLMGEVPDFGRLASVGTILFGIACVVGSFVKTRNGDASN